jgi:hypothetical protein
MIAFNNDFSYLPADGFQVIKNPVTPVTAMIHQFWVLQYMIRRMHNICMKHLMRELKSDETVELRARLRYNAVIERLDGIIDTYEYGGAGSYDIGDDESYTDVFDSFMECYMCNWSPRAEWNVLGVDWDEFNLLYSFNMNI